MQGNACEGRKFFKKKPKETKGRIVLNAKGVLDMISGNERIREAGTCGNRVLIDIANPARVCDVWQTVVMKRCVPVFRAWFFLVLLAAAFQAASAENCLYLFKKGGAEFVPVEAVQEEKMSGILKLTTVDGKVVAWQESMLAAKFRLFDEAAGNSDPASLESTVVLMEDFMAKEPGSAALLKPLAEKWRASLNRNKVQEEDTARKNAEERLARFMAETYRTDVGYPLEALEKREKESVELAGLMPDQSGKIAEYWKPWGEELKNRKAGLEQFEGRWLSPEAIARVKAERRDAARKSFLEKELSFRIEGEALSQNAVYLSLGVMGLSALLFAGMFLGGVKGLFRSPGPAVWISLVIGAGGLGAYALGGWMLFQEPAAYAGSGLVLPNAPGTGDKAALDELIFCIHQPAGSEAPEAPGKVLIGDPALNEFLKNYVKIGPASQGGANALLRRGLKVQVRDDRIVIFDEMKWAARDLVVCYNVYFSETDGGFQFGKVEASIGGLPLSGKLFRHFWSQVEPLMGGVLARSKVLENYYIKRMEPGVVEMVSNRTAPKQAAR